MQRQEICRVTRWIESTNIPSFIICRIYYYMIHKSLIMYLVVQIQEICRVTRGVWVDWYTEFTNMPNLLLHDTQIFSHLSSIPNAIIHMTHESLVMCLIYRIHCICTHTRIFSHLSAVAAGSMFTNTRILRPLAVCLPIRESLICPNI